jgi:hypothetical protein
MNKNATEPITLPYHIKKLSLIDLHTQGEGEMAPLAACLSIYLCVVKILHAADKKMTTESVADIFFYCAFVVTSVLTIL